MKAEMEGRQKAFYMPDLLYGKTGKKSFVRRRALLQHAGEIRRYVAYMPFIS